MTNPPIRTTANTLKAPMDHLDKTASLSPVKQGELESIRGVAALLVVLFHLPKWNPVLDVAIINNSYLMVELFFVLSGFVIFNAYHARIRSVRDLVRFQFLRFGRLYPVHLLFLFAFVLIECAKYIAARKFGIVGPNTAAFQINNLQSFFENLFLISGLLPGDRLTFNGPAWSICVEFYCYLFFALVVLYSGRWLHVLLIVIPCIALVLMGSGWSFGFDHILQCVSGFFLGCLTAVGVRKVTFKISGLFSLAALLSLIAFLFLKSTLSWDLLIYPLSMVLIASLVLSDEGLVKNVLNFRGFTLLGAISYSLYMSHAAVEWAANQAVRVLMKKPEFIDGYGNSIPSLSTVEALMVTFLIAVVVVAVSTAVYYFVENPFRERSRHVARRL